MRTRFGLAFATVFSGFLALVGAQAPGARPASISIHTWVREDVFGGFMDNDMVRFERGEAKVREYLAEAPDRADASAWMAGIKLHRAGLAFSEQKTADGEALVNEAIALMDAAVAKAPNDFGATATTGGSIVTLANKLPEKYYDDLMRRARAQYAKLYAAQSPALAQLPLHLKGELLAGVAETEFRVGDKERAKVVLQQIITELPDTAYAKSAAMWLASPEKVTRDTKLVCQSCHQAGRLSAWQARQKQ